jgi:putative two-component system response regulator
MNQLSQGSTLSKITEVKNDSAHLTSAKILIVDDRPLSRMATVDLLSIEGYQIVETDFSCLPLEIILREQPDAILIDVVMPYRDSFELCRLLKQNLQTRLIPTIVLTVDNDRQTRLQFLEAGGDDFLAKPLDRLDLLAKVKSLIRQKRLNEGLNQTEQVLFLLAKAIENRSTDSGNSCARLAALAQSFGEYLQLSLGDIEDIVFAARIHDIGTIGIPDAVLLKTGELTPEERETIEQHVLIGEKICQPMKNRSGVLPIIRHHHERWDGSGYPDSLIGGQIPKLAQVFQILDIYDALTSNRPHKKALTPEQALTTIAEETAKGWRNPELVGQFTSFIQSTTRGMDRGEPNK